MSKHTLRIGIVSFAHMHAAGYAACLRSLTGVEITGVYDENAERGTVQADRFGAPFMQTLEALLDCKLDGIIICSENAKHRFHVEQVAGRVGHILCEKPIASTAEDGQAMIETCAAAGSHLHIAFPVRFATPIQQLKQMLEREELGHIYAAKCTNHGSMPGDWFIDKALSGGGAVIDHTVHVIDLLRWIWNTEVTEVYAEVGRGLIHPGLDIDDVGLLSFTLANGVYGTLDTSWSRQPPYPTWGDVKIEVVGERGLVLVDALSQHIDVSSKSTGRHRWAGYGSNPDLGLIRDFIEIIRTNAEPSIRGEDGLRALEVALAAYRSAQEGRPIQLA